jgi:hypothetical protein
VEKRRWKRTILALVILSAWSAQTASAELALTLTGRDGSPVQPGVVDSDLLHVTVSGATPSGVYRYQLISQSQSPASAQWEVSPWRPFHQDLYLYRTLDTQWLRIDVVDALDETLTTELALLGGVLTAPPDEPLDPVAWAASIERGFDVAYSQFPTPINEYNEQGLVDIKIAGIDHVRLRTDASATEADLFWHMDRSVDDALRHGLVPIIAYHAAEYRVHATAADKAATVDWWSTVAARYAQRSHKLALNMFIELLGVSVHALSDWNVINDWYIDITAGIRASSPTRNIIYTSIKISDPCQLASLQVPPSAGEYYLAEWHDWAAGPITGGRHGWIGQDGTVALKEQIDERIECALAWTAATSKPTWLGAWMPGIFNLYPDHWYVGEAVEFTRYLTAKLKTAGIPWAANAEFRFYDMPSNTWLPASYLPILEAMIGDAFTIDPADVDGDGLSASEEAALGSDVSEPDTDGDMMLDGQEVAHGFNPLDPSDGNESDSDGDGMPNKFELHWGLNPHDASDAAADGDADGLSNLQEFELVYNPTDAKSGSTQILDGNADKDDDGISNIAEIHTIGTDPGKADTDEDALNDKAEIDAGYDPLDPDMDDDGLLDGDEVAYGLNPTDPADGASVDTDGDGVANGDEIAAGLNPTVSEDGLGPPVLAAAYHSSLGRGVVMTWGAWRNNYEPAVAENVVAKGFDHVRIEVDEPAEAALKEELDGVVLDLLRLGIRVVLSYDVPSASSDLRVAANRQAFIDWWGALAGLYRFHSHGVAFDLVANVRDVTVANAADLNAIYVDAVAAIQGELATRVVVLSPALKGMPADLSKLEIPASAEGYALARWQVWHIGPKNKTGTNTSWTTGTQTEKNKITSFAAAAEAWQQGGGAPLYQGPWRSYDGGHTYTLAEEQAFSQYLIGEMVAHGDMPWAVWRLSDYLDPATSDWISDKLPLIETFIDSE